MKLLLLGPGGQLGSDLLRAAEGRDVRVEGLGRAGLDLEDREAIAPALAAREFDVLVNAAGYTRVDEAESMADRAVAVNAHAVEELAKACATKKARLVQLSTDYVFDGLAERAYREADSVGPLNVYGATKAMGEALARTTHDDVLIFRVASLFGVAGAGGRGGNFVETMIRVGRDNGRLEVVDDQVMSPTATADVAELILDALERNLPAGTWHAVNSGSASWFEFATIILEQVGIDASVEPVLSDEYPTEARRPAYSVLDNARLTEALGPIRHWEDALDDYLKAKGHV